MKKLLLIPALTIGLVGCGDPKDEASEIAQEYCEAIKRTNFEDAENIAVSHVIEANKRWFDQDNRKYRKVFGSQRCGIKKVESSEDLTSFVVYYHNSMQNDNSHVEIAYVEAKDQLLVTSDVFAVYQNFY